MPVKEQEQNQVFLSNENHCNDRASMCDFFATQKPYPRGHELAAISSTNSEYFCTLSFSIVLLKFCILPRISIWNMWNIWNLEYTPMSQRWIIYLKLVGCFSKEMELFNIYNFGLCEWLLVFPGHVNTQYLYFVGPIKVITTSILLTHKNQTCGLIVSLSSFC